MFNATRAAMDSDGTPTDIARAAVREAAATIPADEKEDLAKELYKEATGRFPQNSSDRKAVYVGGFTLVGFIFLLTAALAALGMWRTADVPSWMSTLATALGSATLGGLFGYSRQG